MCKAFYFSDLSVGNNSKNNFGIIMFVTGFCIKKGYAAVDLCKNGIGDILCSSGNDFDFGSGFTEYKGLIKNIGIYKGEYDTVKNAVHRFEHRKKNYNDKIECIKRSGNGDMEQFVKNKGRNIHTTGGSSGTDYKAKSKTDAYAAKNGTKKNVIGKAVISEDAVADFEKNRVAEGTYYGCKRKSFSKNKETDAKHNNVKTKNKCRDRYSKKVFNDKGNTGCSAKRNSGRKNKKLDA